jgi:hypothetical protein
VLPAVIITGRTRTVGLDFASSYLVHLQKGQEASADRALAGWFALRHARHTVSSIKKEDNASQTGA